MRSGLYSFYQIIENVKTETGIQNLRNRYSEIRQLVARAEYEINPYAGFLQKKRMVHFVGNGVFNGKAIKKPADFVMIDKVGCCEEGLCGNSFFENVSHVIICDKQPRTKITWSYWALTNDGEGNPFISYNHAEAVVAFVIWKMYSPKVYGGGGSLSVKNDFERQFNERCLEARGEDFFPNEAQLCRMYQTNKMSGFDFSQLGCADYCLSTECITTITETMPQPPVDDKKVYFWQDNSLAAEIQNAEDVTDEFLSTKEFISLTQAAAGYTFSFPYVGRYGFCIEDVDADSFSLVDLLQQSLENSVNVYYNAINRKLIFISKNYVAASSIYFKFLNNGE